MQSYKLKSFTPQGLCDQIDVLEISRFHFNTKETTVDALSVALFVVNTSDVAAAIGDDAGDLLELSGLVDQLDEEARRTSRLEKSTVDHTG